MKRILIAEWIPCGHRREFNMTNFPRPLSAQEMNSYGNTRKRSIFVEENYGCVRIIEFVLN